MFNKIIIAALILFSVISNQLSAQMMYGGKFGLNFNRFYGNDVIKDNQKSSIGPVFGGVLRTNNYSKLFAMQFELLYSLQGSKYKTTSPFGSINQIFRLHYLRIPVLASFSFGDRKVKAFFNAGPYVGFWMASKSITKNGAKVKVTYEFNDDDRRIDFGAEGGFGLSIETGPGILVPELRAGFGFLSIDKDRAIRNLVLSLAISYLFGGDR